MRLFVIAGEPSGDRLGAALMAGLKALAPEVEFRGVGGPGMEAEGLASLFPMEELTVMGLVEVLPKYRALKRRIAQTAQAVENLKAQLATMDATLADIAKTLCFLTDMGTFAEFNEAYVAGFDGARPARSTIGVAALPFGGNVEIEAWAYKPLR